MQRVGSTLEYTEEAKALWDEVDTWFVKGVARPACPEVLAMADRLEDGVWLTHTGDFICYDETKWGVDRRCYMHDGAYDCTLCRVHPCAICSTDYYADQVVTCPVCCDDGGKNLCFGCASRLIDHCQAQGVADDDDVVMLDAGNDGTVESKYSCPWCKTCIVFVPPQDALPEGSAMNPIEIE